MVDLMLNINSISGSTLPAAFGAGLSWGEDKWSLLRPQSECLRRHDCDDRWVGFREVMGGEWLRWERLAQLCTLKNQRR